MRKPHNRRIEYRRKVFSMRQIRDCVNGSDAVKRAGEMYLPMPSGMELLNAAPGQVKSRSENALSDRRLSISDAPWHHGNAAYSAYVHRAKFPDMTANTLRGLVGIATRRDPEVSIPSAISYLEDLATVEGDTLFECFKKCVGEVFQVGRHALVLDVRKDNTVYFAHYCSESYINWDHGVVDGRKVQTYAEFESITYNEDGSESKVSLCYELVDSEESGKPVCVVSRYVDGKLDGESYNLMVQGKTLDFLPVVNIGSENNDLDMDPMPMLGISDCALDIYRQNADLRHSQFMSCNPTLVFIGVDENDAPKVIGSTVAICISDPGGDAKYITTDTSALSHVKDSIKDVFEEAIQYGAQLLGPTKKSAESAEALALRKEAAGATLVTVVENCAQAINDALNMALRMRGLPETEDMFVPNTEFAELELSAPEMQILLTSWMSGGISHLTYLENMAAAGRLGGRTPEEEMALIEDEGPVGDVGVNADSGDGEDGNEEDEDDD